MQIQLCQLSMASPLIGKGQRIFFRQFIQKPKPGIVPGLFILAGWIPQPDNQPENSQQQRAGDDSLFGRSTFVRDITRFRFRLHLLGFIERLGLSCMYGHHCHILLRSLCQSRNFNAFRHRQL